MKHAAKSATSRLMGPEPNFGNDFQDFSGENFLFFSVTKRKSAAREANPENAKDELLSTIVLRYERLRKEVLIRMKARDTDIFWIQWVEDMMPSSPSASKMWALINKSHLISHEGAVIQMEIECIVVDYFKICTDLDIRSFLKL